MGGTTVYFVPLQPFMSNSIESAKVTTRVGSLQDEGLVAEKSDELIQNTVQICAIYT